MNEYVVWSSCWWT